MVNQSHIIRYNDLADKLKYHPIDSWMIRKGWQWFPHQLQIFEVLDKHDSVLLEAPTGAGKTLASLLPSLLSLSDNKDQTYLHTLYISPQMIFTKMSLILSRN